MNKLFTRIAIIFILINGLSVPVFSQNISPGLAAALQAQLDQHLFSYNLKGMSASVIIPGQGTWNGVSGISHGSVPIDTAMVFGIGSITKSFIATTILLLQQDSLLSVNDSLHQWLPAYPNINPNITIKQLLQHRSGLYNYTTNQDWGNAVNSDFNATWTADQVLSNYINPPLANPGTTFGYSNTNYLLLGRIIEEATDSAWWQVLRYRLLEPYQLTTVVAEQIEPRTTVMPHNWQVLNNGSVFDLSVISMKAIFTSADAAGILASGALDVARFGKLLFEGEILEPASLAQMLQFNSLNAPTITGYGFGMMRINNLGQQAWGHGGNIPGFSSMMIYSPSDSISVSVLVNQDSDALIFGLGLLQAAQQYVVASPEPVIDTRINFICSPNPGNGNVTFSFDLKQTGNTTLQVVNVLGQTVETIPFGTLAEGNHTRRISLSHLPKGMYVCNLNTAQGKFTSRLMIQ